MQLKAAFNAIKRGNMYNIYMYIMSCCTAEYNASGLWSNLCGVYLGFRV